MAKIVEVLRTCWGSVAMATTYVAMFGITVYEYPQYGKHMCMCKHAKLCQCPMSS